MRGLQNWLIFLNLAKRFQNFLALKNFSARRKGFFRQDLQGTCIPKMVPKRVFLMGFFAVFWD